MPLLPESTSPAPGPRFRPAPRQADSLSSEHIYKSVPVLLDLLQECDIKFLKVQYICRLEEALRAAQREARPLVKGREIFCRKQEVRAQAFVDRTALQLCFEGLSDAFFGASTAYHGEDSEEEDGASPTTKSTRWREDMVIQGAVVSHGWLSPTHPDPNGYHLQQLVTFLLDSVDEKLFPAAFMDFPCLGQVPRSAPEEGFFRKALSNLAVLYAHDRTHVVKLQDVPVDAPNSVPYDQRGWCCVEELVSSAKQNAGDFTSCRFKGLHRTAKLPPTPERMRRRLLSLHFTSKKADLEQVAGLYEKVFLARIRTSEEFNFPGRSKSKKDLVVLLELLPCCDRLRRLNLSHSPKFLDMTLRGSALEMVRRVRRDEGEECSQDKGSEEDTEEDEKVEDDNDRHIIGRLVKALPQSLDAQINLSHSFEAEVEQCEDVYWTVLDFATALNDKGWTLVADQPGLSEFFPAQ